jgi:endoglucanase
MKDRFLIASLFIICLTSSYLPKQEQSSWIRVNILGYKTGMPMVAIWCSKESATLKEFRLLDVITGETVFTAPAGLAFGEYGPFKQTYRLDFSALDREGRFVIQAGGASSPEFTVAAMVYKGSADFCLRYMRQQRSGFNPFLKDSCHTRDGYTLYGSNAGLPDSTHIDVSGGWHDASDYLQYVTTSANATYHLLMAYRDFGSVFSDHHLANGLAGKNGRADVLDEAKWGLDWLLKMHPRSDWMFNQLADDRDHMGMRIPKEDSFYGKGIERPVYFLTGEPQVRGKFMNNTTGTSSTAAKFSSAFQLGSHLFTEDATYSKLLSARSASAYLFSLRKKGVTQTASVRAPYIYAEDNWTDDMELAYVGRYKNAMAEKALGIQSSAINPQKWIDTAFAYAQREPVTPWLGADTAKHYQWYPFINVGHYELAKNLTGKRKQEIIKFYKQGIERVWAKAKANAFYRGIPFIWCSNNLTASFAIQCYWYRQLSGDKTFLQLEQACFDWLFGCNPWGTSMVYGLPAYGDTPVDPHSAFTRIGKYPIDGGLVDGPVYTSIFRNLIGITLYEPDEYAKFQSDLAVYHDDYGDYSTNEPTIDGTAVLIYLLAAREFN